MFAVEIEFLAGRYIASCWNDRDVPEWPPHPARFFSAVVAACHEAGGPSALERRALEWLQACQAPAIAAGQADSRVVAPVFVPVNDTAMGSSGPSKLQTVGRAQMRRQAAQALLQLLDSDVPADTTVLCGALEEAIPVLGRRARQRAEHLRDSIRQSSATGDADEARTALLDALPKEAKDATTAIDKNLQDARAAIPLHRPRKERKFPSVTPHNARIQLIWKDATPDQTIRDILLDLLSRVSYLGHSSSLVRCALVDDAADPTWVPDQAGNEVLRVPGPDQLQELAAAHGIHRGQNPRVLPFRPQRYRFAAGEIDVGTAESTSGCFGADWIVFQQLDGPVLPIQRAVDVASALRAAVIEVFRSPEFISRHSLDPRQPVPAVVSGLTDDDQPLKRPHVAFVALPFVEHPHADGHLMGIAAVLPRSHDASERTLVLAALGRVTTLKPAPGLQWTLRRLTPALTRPFSLQPSGWCGRSSMWATATPILLDRFPGHLGSPRAKVASRAEAEARDTIGRACERAGLPCPRTVELVTLPPFRGVPNAGRFRQPARKPSRPRRAAVHAILDFGLPVHGPVLIGAGRYLGLGLCRPVRKGEG